MSQLNRSKGAKLPRSVSAYVDARGRRRLPINDECAAAHGGQILLSAAPRDAVGRSRPAGVRFRDFGSYRLRRLRERQAIFQVGAADLPSRFPALRASAVSRGESDDR